MQSLSAPPRDLLTGAQVSALLEAPDLEVSAGCELLTASLAFVSDISDDLEGGTVSRNNNATIHGTCTMRLARSLVWGVDLVRPYMTLTSTETVARWNLGVYCMITPDLRVGESPATYEVQGYDRLMLLQRQVGADYSVAAGVTYRAALLAVFTAAGLTGVAIDGAAADDTLPELESWPLVPDRVADPDQTTTPVTYLRIANDLLRAINFRSVWCDENGTFRCSAYRDPKTRAVEWDFHTGTSTILGEDRKVTADVWATPNRWVVRATNFGTGVEGDGVYTIVNQSDGSTSVDARGLTWTSVVDYEAASQAKLVELATRRVATDRQITTRYEVTTGPFPGAGHADIATLDGVKVQAVTWSMPLDGGDVSWQFEAV